ncbi:MAG TPA: ABC transporter substrate-binding protein [Beijerinckiaceae bacterium]|jgi:peptide/nickel transport system substrate-binding protein
MQHLAKRTLLASATALGLIGLTLPVLAQTLTIGVRAGPDSIDPHFTASGTHAETLKHVFDTLVWSGDQLQLEPRLAESWKPIDATTWEFKLRRGVKFHDGSDFTADDVKFSIERIPVVSGPNPTLIYVRRVKETKVINPHTVHIVTDGPSPTLPNDFIRLFIVSSKAAAGLTKDNANEAFNTGKAAVGTGPYKFVSWTPKDAFVGERFDGYWGEKQPWARIVRKELPNDAGRVAQLKAGQVDMIVRTPAADLPTLQRDTNLQVVKGDTVYVFYIEFDQRDKPPQISSKDGSPLASNPFKDARVREAFDLAIDRAALAEIAMEGLGKPQSQLVTPNIFGYNDKLQVTKPNVNRARELLTQAGFPNGFKVTFSFTNDRLPGDGAVGAAVSQMLARIGVDVQANGQPGAVLFPARTRGDLSMVMSGWGTLTGEANYTLSSLVHSNAPQLRLGAFNWRNYVNPEMDKALQAAAAEMDEGKRRAYLQQANELTAQDRPLIPLVAVSSAWTLRKDKVRMVRTRADEDTLAMDIAPAR